MFKETSYYEWNSFIFESEKILFLRIDISTAWTNESLKYSISLKDHNYPKKSV